MPTRNVGQSSKFWFTSRSGTGYLNLHSVVVFADYDTEVVYAFEKLDLYGFSAESSSDYASASVWLESVFYKSILGSTIGTFESCQYNEILTTDYTLEGRSCDPCSSSKPISYGYSDT